VGEWIRLNWLNTDPVVELREHTAETLSS